MMWKNRWKSPILLFQNGTAATESGVPKWNGHRKRIIKRIVVGAKKILKLISGGQKDQRMAKLEIYDQIEEYLHYCQYTRGMSNMTLKSKKHTYLHFAIDSECEDLRHLTNRNFDLWMEKQKKAGVSNRTINTRMAHIKAMIRYFKEMDMEIPIKLPLIHKLHEGKVNRTFYTPDQVNKALRFADEIGWLLIKICFDSGLRVSELRNLRLSNFNGQMVRFVGKGNKDRESYISHDTYEKLQSYIESNSITDELWLNPYGRQYSVDELRIRMRKPFEAAGFTNFHPHALRHSFATDIQNKGASLLEMQTMLGHSNAQTTERYIHGLDGKNKALFDKYKGERGLTKIYHELLRRHRQLLGMLRRNHSS